MKKSLLALAVLGAFTGIASAQTSVTIYGVVDAGITREDNGTGIATRLDSGNQSGNRLGFRGTEDLGGGLAAQFVLEQGFNLDTGTAADATRTAFNRQAFVGLVGGFGQVRLGRQKTVIYDALDAIDPFHIANRGSGIQRLFALNTGGTSRSDNTLAYFTPNISGFTGQATYTFGEQPTNAAGVKGARQYGLSANYAAGPLFVTLDYLNQNDATAANTAKTTLLGGTYDFGVAKAHLGFANEKGGLTASPVIDQRDYMVGASIPFGASAVQVDYLRKNDNGPLGTLGARQYTLGYTYALSKRTNFYASYASTRQDAAANYVAPAGQTDKILNAGVRHTF